MDFKALIDLPAGRAFIANFAYCKRYDLFPRSIDPDALLRDVLAAASVPAPPRQRGRRIGEVLGARFHAALADAEYALTWSDAGYHRIVPFSRFISGDKPLLTNEATLRFGHLRSGGWSEAELTIFAQRAVAPENINPLAEMRGRHPFAWITDRGPETVESRAGRSRACKSLVQALGLEGFDDGEALFAIRYPAGARRVRRPTALDGFGGRLFKARTTRDDAIGVSRSGYALDLALIEGGHDPETHSHDGAPEFVTPPISFDSTFEAMWLGEYHCIWSSASDEIIEKIIFASNDPDEALSICIDYLRKSV